MRSAVVWVVRYGPSLIAALVVLATFGVCAWVIGGDETPLAWRLVWVGVGALLALKGLLMASELLLPPPSRPE